MAGTVPARHTNAEENAMRSDAQLKQDVCEELKWDPEIRAEGIGVQVNDGVLVFPDVLAGGAVAGLEQGDGINSLLPARRCIAGGAGGHGIQGRGAGVPDDAGA
jgi:hypothetical protein